MAPPQRTIPNDPDLLPAVRELWSQQPAYRDRGADEIAEGLYCLRHMSHRPHVVAVEGVLEALATEGEPLP
jgi:hypothetical protein